MYFLLTSGGQAHRPRYPIAHTNPRYHKNPLARQPPGSGRALRGPALLRGSSISKDKRCLFRIEWVVNTYATVRLSLFVITPSVSAGSLDDRVP